MYLLIDKKTKKKDTYKTTMFMSVPLGPELTCSSRAHGDQQFDNHVCRYSVKWLPMFGLLAAIKRNAIPKINTSDPVRSKRKICARLTGPYQKKFVDPTKTSTISHVYWSLEGVNYIFCLCVSMCLHYKW